MAKLGFFALFLRRLSDFFWPGDHDRGLAKEAFKAYLVSRDVASLDTAMKEFQRAVDQYRKHKSPSLLSTLINYAIAVWKHYEDCGRSPEDLEKVIRLETEARDSWYGEKDSSTYVFLLNALAGAYFEQYQRAFGLHPIKSDEKQTTFDEAVKYYTELRDNRAARNQRNATQIQLGVIFRMRSELEQTLNSFEIGVRHLQDALLEATEAGKDIDAGNESDEAKQRKKEAVDDIKATCFLNLAESYEVRYTLVGDPRQLHDLTMAIDCNTRAKPLLEILDRPELPHCMFNLARQLWLRWRQTRDPVDYDIAKQTAEAVKRDQTLDVSFEHVIDHILSVLAPDESLQNRIDDLLHPSK